VNGSLRDQAIRDTAYFLDRARAQLDPDLAAKWALAAKNSAAVLASLSNAERAIRSRPRASEATS
jgi:hypothetical protein